MLISKRIFITIALSAMTLVTCFAQADEQVKVSTQAKDTALRNPLYFFVADRGNTKILYVAETYTTGESKTEDVTTLNLNLTTKTKTFGANESIPFSQVLSFQYDPDARSKKHEMGNLTIETNAGKIVSEDYSEHWPIKHVKEKGWTALVSITGKAYDVNNNRIYPNQTLSLSLKDLSDKKIWMDTEDKAQSVIKIVENYIADQNKQNQQRRIENQAQVERERELAKAKVAKLAKEPRGSEDSCKRVSGPSWVVLEDPPNPEMRCAFAGNVNLEQLQSAGWLIVNKTRDSTGVVTDYYIRKAR